MTEKSEERIYREAKKRIDMRKNGIHPSDYFEGWVVDYIDSVTTDKLSVEKLQEQLNTAKKALTESEKMYQKLMDRFLNSEMNESARSHCESQLKLLSPAHKAFEALAAIGGDDE
ncbi:MAG: hypothetical protein RSC67_06800 [Carnobacterium sp.]